MPSQRSISESAYYAHPRNAFWWIMSQMLDFPEQLGYKEKCEQLKQSKYALWDVLYDCQREGSLDKNIKRDTESANDFSTFFRRHSTIKYIAFNGTSARTIFMRHCKDVLRAKYYITSIQLPSTSPAHASMDRYEKLTHWRKGLQAA